MFENITVVFFTIKNTERVYKIAFTIAKKFDAELFVLKCFYKEASKFVFFDTKKDKAKYAKKLEKAQKSLAELEKIAAEDGLSIKSQIDHTPNLSDDVVAFIKSHKVDLLIMDTHQHHEGESNKDLVSRIYRQVNCPILTL